MLTIYTHKIKNKVMEELKFKIMQHKVLSTGLHTILDNKGRVHVFTESEYTHLSWWKQIKIKFNLKSI